MAAPCEWDVDPVALGVCADWAELPAERQATALALATSYLWAVTGRRFGVCPVTVRPSQALRGAELAYQTFHAAPGLGGLGTPGGPFLFGGRWFNAGCSTACCGNSACAVVLRGPVASVYEVLIGDEVVPPSAYRVDVTGGAWLLVRTDGECWPLCQNFTADEGEPGSFVVDYGQGSEVPLALQVAAAMLACEYSKALAGGPCKLPSKMTRLSRQGVEIELEPPDPADGKTGIREVDQVVATYNPGGLQRPPQVLSLDLPEQCDRATVWAGGS
jgi:hypothetical protein